MEGGDGERKARMKYFNNVQVPWYYSAGRWVLYITLHYIRLSLTRWRRTSFMVPCSDRARLRYYYVPYLYAKEQYLNT